MRQAPEMVEAIHREYARAGARVHRTNTFRTRRRSVGPDWECLVESAVFRARAGAGTGRVAGSLGPLEDCYRPDLSPPEDVARAEHAELARALVRAGVDLLVCETFPSVTEAHVAVEVCAATGLEVWVSLTAGPSANLMTPEEMAAGARACANAGASAVLVNCVAASLTMPYVEALAAIGVPFGAYANGSPWNEPPIDPQAYVACARAWMSRGASILGCCCGTGPSFVRALARLVTDGP